MTNPRHPGSRVVDHQPNILRVIRAIQEELRKIRDKTRPEVLTFVDADPSRGVPCVSGAMVSTHETKVYRSGDSLYADVACGTGAASSMEVQLAVPDLGVTGTPVASGTGGTEQIVRVALAMPTSWDSGAAYLTYVQARRATGADATTVRVLRAWQR